MKHILVVDDHKIIFRGIEAKLKKHFRVSYAADMGSAKEIAADNKIYAAIIDISLGRDNGFDLAYDVKGFVEHIFFFSMHNSPTLIHKTKEAKFKGYFLKDEPIELLIEALTFPHRKSFWATETVERILELPTFDDATNYDSLTTREQQVFRMIAEGKKPKDIASILNLSTKTISVHRENLMRKLQLATTTDIVRAAIKIGIIQL